MAAYVSDLKVHKATGREAEQRAAKFILPTLGKVRLSDLTSMRLIHGATLCRAAGTHSFPPRCSTELPASSEDTEVGVLAAHRQSNVDNPPRGAQEGLQRRPRRSDSLGAGHAVQETRRRLGLATSLPSRPIDWSMPPILIFVCWCVARSKPDAGSANWLRPGCATIEGGKLYMPRSKSGKARSVVLGRCRCRILRVAHHRARSRRGDLPARWCRPLAEERSGEADAGGCAAARIKPAVPFHSLRHTWASWR